MFMYATDTTPTSEVHKYFKIALLENGVEDGGGAGRRSKRDDGKLLCRVRQGGGGGRSQSQDVQVVYGRQVLQRRVPEEHKKYARN